MTCYYLHIWPVHITGFYCDCLLLFYIVFKTTLIIYYVYWCIWLCVDVADTYIQISSGFLQLATIENTELDK